jgi:hypothetical protein
MGRERFVMFGATGCLVALVVLLFWQWVFMRFWLYRSQNRNLNPADYEVRVLTGEEYEQLLDPNVRQVRIANGSRTVGKAGDPDWEAKAKSRYKSVYNGKYHVQVTTKGTAHALGYCYDILVPSVIFSLGGLLFIVVYHLMKKVQQ